MHRRHFIFSSTALAAGVAAGRSVLAVGPNSRLRTAHVGVGGMGSADLNSISSHANVEVAALCDVDHNNLSKAKERFPKAKLFRDYRQMIGDMGDRVDGVIVSTPDHTHAPAALAALSHNKPVYCQKPLTYTIDQARQLREMAAAKKLVTQMGIQVHASQPYRRATKMIQDGVIGKVSEVHAWSNKNWGYDGGPIQGSDPIPSTLDWKLWLGTAAARPYKTGVYDRGQWRKLVDFGTGTLGDMGVHIFDTPYRALQLTTPNWAHNICRAPTGVGHPERNEVTYEFPGTDFTTNLLTWKWYDGAAAPPKLEHDSLPASLELPGQGALFIGEQGTLLLPHVAEPQLYPEKQFADYKRPEVAPLNHYHQWVDACFGKTETSAHFGYAGPLTESLLKGVVAGQGLRG